MFVVGIQPALSTLSKAAGAAGTTLMWMLILINTAVLAGLLATLWQLHRLQTSLLVHDRPSHQSEQILPQCSGLDEFPEESSLPGARRQMPSRSRVRT